MIQFNKSVYAKKAELRQKMHKIILNQKVQVFLQPSSLHFIFNFMRLPKQNQNGARWPWTLRGLRLHYFFKLLGWPPRTFNNIYCLRMTSLVLRGFTRVSYVTTKTKCFAKHVCITFVPSIQMQTRPICFSSFSYLQPIAKCYFSTK